MTSNKRLGPLLTLAAVAALGVGIWLVNVSQETTSEPNAPVAQSTTTAPPPTAATTTATAAPVSPAFPANANYVGKIQAPTGAITLELTVAGDRAIAYACDGNSVEVWLRGSATDGVLTLENRTGTSSLSGRLQDGTVVGTLTLDGTPLDFTAAPVEPPAGLYVYEGDGVRNSWIVDADGNVTGVQRGADGATGPAAALAADGTAVVDGVTVTATKVEGEGDVN